MALPDSRAVSSAPLKFARSAFVDTIGERVGWPKVAALAAAAAYLTFSIVYLLDYPPVYSDEPWLLSGPIHILKSGHDGLPMFGEHYSAALYYDYYIAGFLKLFGIGIGAGRFISVLHGLGVIVLVYLIACRIAPRTAWLAPVALPAMFPFTEASHYIRPDIIATFYGVLAVWLFLLGRDGRAGFLVAAGASAGFSFGLYFQGAWAVALLGLWAAADWRRLRAKVAWIAAGTVGALMPWLVFVVSDLHDYRRFTTKFGGSSIFGTSREHRSFATAVWHSLQAEPDRYLAVERWSHTHVYVVALVALALVSLVGTAAEHRFRVASFLLIPLVTIAAGGINKTSLYFVVGAPALAVLAGAFAVRNRAAFAVALVLTIALAAGYGYNVARAITPVRTDYRDVVRAYRSAFRYPPGSLVIGQPTVYGYYLPDRNIEFRSVHFFTSFRDFHLERASEIAARLGALSRTRNVYLVYDAPSFYATMEEFDFTHSRLPALRRLVTERFKPVAVIHLRDSASGDVDTTIALYVPPSARRSS